MELDFLQTAKKYDLYFTILNSIPIFITPFVVITFSAENLITTLIKAAQFDRTLQHLSTI